MVSTGNQSLILWGEIIYHLLLMILKYTQFQVGLLQFVGRFGKLRIKLVYQESIWDYLLWSICLCSYAVMQHWTDLHSGPLGDAGHVAGRCLYHVQAARNILVVTEDVSMTVVQKSVSRWLHETNLEDEDWAAVCAGCNRLIGVCVFWLIFSLVYVIMTFGSLPSAFF